VASPSIRQIIDEVSRYVVGMEDVIALMLIAMLTEGHILIEGPAGTGKTHLAKVFASTIGGSFSRIQMTPDLLPADIIGTIYYDIASRTWQLKRGPIFANVILADELNRATPKAQAALLEAMQEMQVSIEGKTYELPRPFLLIATQIPYGGEGTYPLTDVQRDRFAYSVEVSYPSREQELAIISSIDFIEKPRVSQVVSASELVKLIESVVRVKVSERVKNYILDIVARVRSFDEVSSGPGPRASIWLLKGSRALAFLESRDYVIPDDVKKLAYHVLPHRIKVKLEYQADNISPLSIVEKALKEVEVPKY
jgi:MoxR-like ATPase